MKAGLRPWRALLVSIAALVAVLTLFEFTGIDLAVQDRLFDFESGAWLVDAKDPLGRALFYNGPKYLIIAGAAALLLLVVGPAQWRDMARLDRRGLAIAVLTLASVPAIIGFAKARTNVFRPCEIRRYGGDVPYLTSLKRFAEDDRPARKGRGFPAGHPSGGFSLVGMLWLRRGRAWRAGVIALALTVGWWMGSYQMLKGAHYLSHTVVTMVFAVCVALAWRCMLPGPSAVVH